MRELPQVSEAVAAQRDRYIETIAEGGFLGFAGGCALTEERDILERESTQLAALQQQHDGLATGQRLNPWKPRTPKPAGQPQPYAGLETVEPQLTQEILASRAAAYGSVALEAGLSHHVRYLDNAAMVWFGARNKDYTLLEKLALYDPRILFGIKNPLSGDIRPALNAVATINERRQVWAWSLGIQVAPAVVIYRGGENAKTEDEWIEQRMKAFEASGGLMIDDSAHGSEMACDPEGVYQKSEEGQKRAQEHLVRMCEAGYGGIGVLMEASDTRSDVDPNMSFSVGLSNMERMYLGKMANQLVFAA
jgi:hypothetical protein